MKTDFKTRREYGVYSAVNIISKTNLCILWENILKEITDSWGYKPQWLFSELVNSLTNMYLSLVLL